MRIVARDTGVGVPDEHRGGLVCRLHVCALCTASCMSGASALLFENLWFRLAGLTFGNSIWAATLVIAAFMAGLAAGNGWAARFGDRVRNPLRLYGVLEFAIGISGLLLVLLLPQLELWMTPFYRQFGESQWSIHATRLSVAFALFLIPTSAMGATLPLLVRSLRLHQINYGSVLGRLYGWNTLGAVAGVLAGEIVLIRLLGIAGASVAACWLNVMAGGIAFIASLSALTARPSASALASDCAMDVSITVTTTTTTRVLAASATSGFLLLALEVVWFRELHFVYHSTSLVFALMLALVLAGIAAGSLAAASAGWRGAAILSRLPALAFGCGFAVVTPYLGFDVIYGAAAVSGLSVGLQFLFVSGALMVPASFASGFLFTQLGAALNQTVGGDARTAGLLTLANTLGASAGPLVSGFLFLPFLGIDNAVLVAGIGYGFVAVLLAAPARAMEPGLVRSSKRVFAVYGALLLVLAVSQTQARHLRLVDAKLPDATRVALRVGPTDTAAYYRYDRYGEPFFFRLVTNGFSMSSTDPRSQRYMKLFVHLPLAIHPGMEQALLIGYGVGSTAQALTRASELQNIDIVDISREILDLSNVVFPNAAEHPLHDPRVNVYVEDGRYFLRCVRTRYDLITSEPPPPKNAGVVNLYSQEFFQLVHDRLADGGIMTHWLPVYQMDEVEAKSIARAFLNVFPDATLWEGGGLNWILMGTRECAGPASLERFVQQWSDRSVLAGLQDIGIEAPALLGATFVADSKFIEDWTASSLPLTDNYPQRLSADTWRGRNHAHVFAKIADRDAAARFRTSATILRWWPAALHRTTLECFAYQRLLENVLGGEYRSLPRIPVLDLQRLLTETDYRALPLFILGTTPLEGRLAANLVDTGILDDYPEAHYTLGCVALAERRYAGAIAHLEAAVHRDSGTLRAVHRLAIQMTEQTR